MPRFGVIANLNTAFFLMLALLPLNAAKAVEYYVDQKNSAANDANPGTEAAPWSSLAPINRFTLQPGDIVRVKAGNYRQLEPKSSGKSGSQIVISSSPAFAATITSTQDGVAAVQLIDQDHVVVEGFNIVNNGQVSILIKGNKSKPVDGIVLRNNVIKSASPRDATTEGIRIDDAQNIKVESNEIDGQLTGVRIGGGVADTLISKNIISHSRQAILINNIVDATIRDVKISNNILSEAEIMISFVPGKGIIRRSTVKNNIFSEYSVAAIQVEQPGMGKAEIVNNIFKRTHPGKLFIADVITYDDPPLSIAQMDNNLFSEQPVFVTGLYSSNRRQPDLKSWRDFSEQDRHSVVSEVAFRNISKNDFRTVKSLPRKMTVGAYTASITEIGNIRIKDDGTKPAGKPKDVAADKTTKPETLASLGAIESKPIEKNIISKLEWDLDRRIQFGGKCVLESNKIDFYDGYDNTGLKFRVLDNQLYLLTKSNIDMSFHDVGVQIGKNELLHADEVVQDQNVIIARALPEMITQLRKSSEARVQLRFWPTYPATRTYSETVSLDGFLPAYESYKDCQKGN